ncbi:hypothetical protein CPAR01_04392 [Colletotrichum paranaense]|uniref:C2H2-type domain-containing protein n=1 Tax=Colletotrichum paranaense TaxID=1914294 RepID=A0ABQ9SWV4_9PEZI|nr:uncharacterized protein CPAR01_04392 [Colletotrichum paranaense]KAK1543759.1 hypothetical protein CPAR01_04392 [Colletotrichum paranaense]
MALEPEMKKLFAHQPCLLRMICTLPIITSQPLVSASGRSSNDGSLALFHDTIYQALELYSFPNHARPDSPPNSYQRDVDRGSHYPALFCDLHRSVNSDNPGNGSYNGRTGPIATTPEHRSIDRSEDHSLELILASFPYSFDESSMVASQSGSQNSVSIGCNALQDPQRFFATLPIVGNAAPSAQCSTITPSNMDNGIGFSGPRFPERQHSQAGQAIQASDFLTNEAAGDLIVVPGHPMSTKSAQVAALRDDNNRNKGRIDNSNRASYSQFPLGGSIRRRRDDYGLDRSSTPGDCPFCENFSGDAKRLRDHIRCHIKEHACEVPRCSQRFSTARDLLRHDRSAHQKAKLICHICEASIRGGRLDNLKRHMRQRHPLVQADVDS